MLAAAVEDELATPPEPDMAPEIATGFPAGDPGWPGATSRAGGVEALISIRLQGARVLKSAMI